VPDDRYDNEENKQSNNSNSQQHGEQHTDQEQRNKETHLRPSLICEYSQPSMPASGGKPVGGADMCQSPCSRFLTQSGSPTVEERHDAQQRSFYVIRWLPPARDDLMRRRDFIAALAGSVAVWPLAAGAQDDRKRRIAVLMNRAAGDPEGQARIAAFREALQKLGWNDGTNVQIDIRWGEDDVERERNGAAELLALNPDIVFASGTLSVAAFQHTDQKLPIVFVAVTDPVGAGLVDNLPRPGGNITGFMNYEYSFGGKKLELLKQIAPNVKRVTVFRDPANPAASAEFAAIQALGQLLGVEVHPIDSRKDLGQIERAITTFAKSPNGGVILTPSAAATLRGDQIISLITKSKLPAVYPFRHLVAGGGLASIGPDVVAQCRLAASYIDRVLKGEKPGELPVQAPTKYVVVINLRIAKLLGLTVSPALLAAADEVIE